MSAKHRPASPLLMVFLAAVAFAALQAAVPPEWPPISAEDAAMKDCSRQPGAPAVILYREETTDVGNEATAVFMRLKILTAAGLESSNIEIPFIAGYHKVTGIEARVVPPQGPARVFDGQIFEKTALRYRKLRMAAKTFALPNVEVGSIIDYRYKLGRGRSSAAAKSLNALITGLMGRADRPEEGGEDERNGLQALTVCRWEVQEDLFTKHLKLSYSSPLAWLSSLIGGGGRLAWASVGMKLGKPIIIQGSAVLEMYNVPAFAAEDHMIPEDMARMSIDLFYIGGEVKSTDEFWKLESKDWQKGVEEFIGRPGPLAAKARGIIGDATEPAAQLKRIYANVQGLRNLSYEKGLTVELRKAQKIKDNRRVEDVLERGYGLRSDITRTFVKLAKAAGFKAEVVRVTTRDDKLFRKDLLSFYDQLDSEAALVDVGGTAMILDPATPFCPFGLVHWTRTDSMAVRFSDAPPSFFATAPAPPDAAMTRRGVALTLDRQGNLAGRIKVSYSGQEALVWRLEHLDDDEAARRSALEKEIDDRLPMGASAILTNIENTGAGDSAVVAYFDVSIPGAATVVGEKMILPVFPLTGPGRYPFRETARRYPVSFPYPFCESDDILITLPEGLAAEVRPEARRDLDDVSSYTLVCADAGPGRLRVQRDFTLRKNFFPVERYAAVKAMFDSMRSSEEAQVVLTAAKK